MRNTLSMAELERDATLAQDCIGRVSSALALAERAASGAAASSNGSRADVFRPRNTAPGNPVSIVMDFASEDSDGQPATYEGKLKSALLQNATGSSLGVVAQGMGGVGKTCALRALAADEQVNDRFPGGVYFMSLGAEATTKKVIDELAGSVDASGGKTEAAEMRKDSSLARAIHQAHDWFAGHCCLFIFDGLWCSNDIEEDILEQLSFLVGHCGKGSPSRLLCSTRDECLSLHGERVAFRPREALGKEARAMLLRAAGAEPEEEEDTVSADAICRILKRCGGLPVALNLCGMSLKRMRAIWAGDKKEVWSEYSRKLESKFLLTRSFGSYGSLDAALPVSPEFLDRENEKKDVPLRQSHRKMHRALCILRRQDWIPVRVLGELWDLYDGNCAEDVVMDMAGVGVAYAEHRRLDDGT